MQAIRLNAYGCHMTTSIGTTGIVPTIDVRHRIAIARDYAGIKQSELAEQLGMSRSTLASIEQGVRKPRRGEIIAIAFATGVDLTWLETGKTPGGDMPTEGEECAIRESNPEPTDLRLVA